MRLFFVLAMFASVAFGEHVPSVFEVPAPGEVKPTGWLLDVMQAARDGYTAHMDEVDEQFRMAWAETTRPRGKDVHWWANPGSWSAEGGAYWFDGLVRMAFQLDDDALKTMISNRLETVITKTTPDSWGFLWWLRRDNPEDVKALKGDAFLLANSEKLVSTIGAWYEATGDKRAERALRTAFSGAAFEIYKPIGGAYKAWQLTGDKGIAELLDKYCVATKNKDRHAVMQERYIQPPPDFLGESLWMKYRHELMFGIPTRHGIGASRGLTKALRLYQWTGDTNFLTTVRAWCKFLDTHCRLPFGQWVMDEEWGWAGPNRATETCTAACENAFRVELLAALGEGTWADDVEESVFNVGPNCTTSDFSLHTYMQQPNRIKPCDLSDCSHGGDEVAPPWNEHGRYARKHSPLCCTAGLNRIWPDFVQAMWLKVHDGGVAAAMFGPCTFATTLAGNERFAVRETTNYPFEDTIRFTIESAPQAAYPFFIRIPRWSEKYVLTVNGEEIKAVPTNGFVRLARAWRVGDVVTLQVPMVPRFATIKDMNCCARGEAPKHYGYLKLGPLLFAKCLPMKDVNTPFDANVTLPELTADNAVVAEVVRAPMPAHWKWSPDAPPVKLHVNDAQGKTMTLVPYGTAKFRISMFPTP